MNCQTVQPIQQDCINCKVRLGNHFCSICRFHDSTPNKPIYHCDKCGLCRVGKFDSFFHCDECKNCFPSKEHPCRKISGDCPICGEDLYTSTKSFTFFRCGHAIHKPCLEHYIRSNFICPICRKSLLKDMSSITKALDRSIELQPMPEIYRETRVDVFCNDCELSSNTTYHWLGNKCLNCNNYNTQITHYHNKPTATTIAQFFNLDPSLVTDSSHNIEESNLVYTSPHTSGNFPAENLSSSSISNRSEELLISNHRLPPPHTLPLPPSSSPPSHTLFHQSVNSEEDHHSLYQVHLRSLQSVGEDHQFQSLCCSSSSSPSSHNGGGIGSSGDAEMNVAITDVDERERSAVLINESLCSITHSLSSESNNNSEE